MGDSCSPRTCQPWSSSAEDGADDGDATRQVLDSYADVLGDQDDGPVVWLALAFAQSKIGRLDPAVAARALEIIDSGEGMNRWREQGASATARRELALGKVRAQLTGPQPPRRRLRPPWRHISGLRPGDVLPYRSGSRASLTGPNHRVATPASRHHGASRGTSSASTGNPSRTTSRRASA